MDTVKMNEDRKAAPFFLEECHHSTVPSLCGCLPRPLRSCAGRKEVRGGGNVMDDVLAELVGPGIV